MSDYESIARQIATKAGIDPDIFANQIRQESGFDPQARSSAGALGIAQIVPRWHPGVDPMNPIEALSYAANQDAAMLHKYGGDWRDVLSVYNSGQPGKWQDPNFAGGQTYNYVKKILGGGVPASTLPSAVPGAGMPQSGPDLSGALLSTLGKGPEAMLQALANAVSAAPRASAFPSALPAAGPPGGAPPAGGLSGLAEAFYDPLGSYDQGRFGGPIGGHSDHVHISATTPQEMLSAISLAGRMGLHVGENPYVGKVAPVHVKDSYHYRDFPGTVGGKKLGEAIDVSGPPEAMAAFYRTMTGKR